MAGKCCAALHMTIPLVVDHDRRPGRARVQRDAGPAVPDRPGREGGLQGRPRAVRVQARRIGAANRHDARRGEADDGRGRPVPGPVERGRLGQAARPRRRAQASPARLGPRYRRHPAAHDCRPSSNWKTCTGPRTRSTRSCGRWSAGSSPTPTGASTPRRSAVADLKRAGGTAEEVAALRGDRSPLSAGNSAGPRRRPRADAGRVQGVRRPDGRACGRTSAIRSSSPSSSSSPSATSRTGCCSRSTSPPEVGRAAAAERRPVQAAVGRRRGRRPGRRCPAPSDGTAGTRSPTRDWRAIDFPSIQKFMESQRGREPRVSVPTAEDVLKHLPPGCQAVADQVEPRLPRPLAGRWPSRGRTACGRSPRSPSRTGCSRSRSSGSSPASCSASTEWATPKCCSRSRASMTRRFRSGPGSWPRATGRRFPPAERAAFAYARKMSKEPWSVTRRGCRQLKRHFGPERALDVIWWACRCHYMTRVADAFQFPARAQNVFQH